MTPIAELVGLFLRLGASSFGGPAAHIAMMREEVVRRRGWLSDRTFIDYLSAANLIPGPNSTELAMHIGHDRAGWRGLLAAGTAFIVPAALIVGALAAAYTRYATVPDVALLFTGVKPVVIAVVAHAVWGLGRTILARPSPALVGIAALAALVAGVNELIVLAVSGAVMWLITTRPSALGIVALTAAPAAAVVAPPAPFSLGLLFALFLKIGAVLFGSGYVLLAFLRADFVERLGWLSEQQLLDAVAIGQITPGPVFTTATFIGYILGGPSGAAVATAGIFLPAFVFVALTRPLLTRIRASARAARVLDGINAASLAMMVFVLMQLARAALISPLTVGIAAASLLAIAVFRINSALLMAAGGAAVWLAG
jgi:chromate transporter